MDTSSTTLANKWCLCHQRMESNDYNAAMPESDLSQFIRTTCYKCGYDTRNVVRGLKLSLWKKCSSNKGFMLNDKRRQ